MSFFGLTALGPQSPFLAASSGDKTLLHVFDEDDFKSAFDKIENNGVIKASDLIDLLQIVYRGPVPSHLSELEKLRSALHVQNDNEPISWTRLRDAQIQVRKAMNSARGGTDSTKNVTCTSHQQLKDLHRRNTRPGPKMQFVQPITAGQEFGWNHDQINRSEHIIRGKRSCAETEYASELIKSGVYY
mmetsp:Transcript_29357/g.43107  ORF Transcript_29357/g.43107 Transcript_29357/m.43107 type:complete len:187 (-) Transcript_29357:1177-1737(-)